MSGVKAILSLAFSKERVESMNIVTQEVEE